ncbi:hypothetical protein NL108_016074 [Boleophthalmus pectinirostris]|uniref:sclerostin domain-containing protein 1b n=1 Tax=Boleophthalmus pectinirostris TaxID=150288 RepID=UPI000A1C37DB|nr:sclerostin domain-containing protein 1b [Boleophthalmus pectinirostris]KAJ0055347.1 hypothetical protein NL108_016074 [Boleophthalmus pectinirostris]
MENFLVLLVILLGRLGSCTVHNDATEALDRPAVVAQGQARDEPVQEDSNQARNGGRRGSENNARSGPDQSQVGCRELRSTKYISDGQCTSVNPIKELVCAGECLPSHLLPNWIGGASNSGRYWSRRDTVEWRCVIDRTRTQRIRLQCEDGSSRTYKITVVTSCKCKRYSRQQNDSAHRDPAHTDNRRRSHKKTALPEEQTA